MARKETKGSTDISYDEIQKELEKYSREDFTLTDEEIKMIEMGRDLNVSWPNIAKVFNKTFNKKRDPHTLYKQYTRLKKK